jgi:hypothetical protein
LSVFLVGLGFELQALHFQSRHSTAILPVHFVLIILEVGVSCTICLVGLEPWSSWSHPPK